MNEPTADPVVYVVDDDCAMLDSLRFLVESVGWSVQTFESAEGFLQSLTDDLAGCLVADLRLPGSMNGLDMRDEMIQRGTHLPTIIITAHGEVPHAVRAFKSGVIDFVQKPLAHGELLDRIEAAVAYDVHLRRDAARRRTFADRYQSLTRRESEVMEQVAAGKPNKQIAAELDLSSKTIEVHRASVMRKMQADSLPDLVRMSLALNENEDQPAIAGSS